MDSAPPENRFGRRHSPRSDLMGQRDRVFRRQMLAIRHKAVASAPSLRWNSITEDAPYGFRNVCLVMHFEIMILPSPLEIRICYIGTARLIRTRLHRSSRPAIIAPGLS